MCLPTSNVPAHKDADKRWGKSSWNSAAACVSFLDIHSEMTFAAALSAP